MRVLFDNRTTRGVAAALSDHIVEEARARGWDTLKNGELLDAAEAAAAMYSSRQTETSDISRT